MKSRKGLRLRTSRRNPLKVTLVEADMRSSAIIIIIITVFLFITITFAVGTQEWSRMLGPR